MNDIALEKSNKHVIYWLYACAFCVILMVAIGGLTRLTDSGLSITEWKPITGIIPPLNDEQWNIEFDKYKASPEYIHIHNQINMEQFKNIYLLEFYHRLAGRAVGLIFFIPLVIFWWKGVLALNTKYAMIVVAFLGICQGFMGWYMVKSGLTDSPYVSHFRLTFHLLFALAIYITLIFESLRLKCGIFFLNLDKKWKIMLSLTILQIALGGLVAGLDAGLIYNEFPKMGDGYIPNELYEIHISDYFYNQAFVQFIHRLNAYLVAIYASYLACFLLNQKQYTQALMILLAVFAQFLLGVITLLLNVQIWAANGNQVFAFILIWIIIFAGISSKKKFTINL